MNPRHPGFAVDMWGIRMRGSTKSKAARWLREGAGMLTESCPRCGFPLFDRRGEY